MKHKNNELTEKEELFLNGIKNIDTSIMSTTEIYQIFNNEISRDYVQHKLRERKIPFREISEEEQIFANTIKNIDTSTMTLDELVDLFNGQLKKGLIRAKLKKNGLNYKKTELKSEKEEYFIKTIKNIDTSKMTGNEIYNLFNGSLSKEYMWRQIKKHNVPYLRYVQNKEKVLKKQRIKKVSIGKRYEDLLKAINQLYKLGLPVTWKNVGKIEELTASRVQAKYKDIGLDQFKKNKP